MVSLSESPARQSTSSLSNIINHASSALFRLQCRWDIGKSSYSMGTSKFHSPMNGDGKDDDASGPGHGGDTSPQGERTTGFVIVGLLRFLGTAVLAVLFYVIIRLHQGRTLTSGEKSIFDALIVAVSLTLGLNSAASLRHIALYATRWFAEKRRIHVKEVSFQGGGWRGLVENI